MGLQYSLFGIVSLRTGIVCKRDLYQKATASGMIMHQCGVSGQQLPSGENFSYMKYTLFFFNKNQ